MGQWLKGQLPAKLMMKFNTQKSAIGETKIVISIKLDEEKNDETVKATDQRFHNREYISLKPSNFLYWIIGLFIYGGSCWSSKP